MEFASILNPKLITNELKKVAFFAFLLTVPIFLPMNVMDLRVVQERYFQVGVMVIGSLYFGNIWMTLFMWLNLVLFYMNGCVVGSSQILNIFCTGLLFAFSRDFFKNRSIRPYLNALYIVAILTITFMIMQSLSIDPISVEKKHDGAIAYNDSFNMLTGLFCLPAFNGMFLTIISALLIFTGSWVGFLMAVPIYFSKSSGAFLGFAAIVAFWAYYYKPNELRLIDAHEVIRLLINTILIPINFIIKRFFLFVIGAMAVVFIAYTAHDYKVDKLTYNSRFENWMHMISLSAQKPLGWGPDSFRNYTKRKNFLFCSDENYNPLLRVKKNDKEDMIRYFSADRGKTMERFAGKVPVSINKWEEAHNEFIQFFFEYGILGLLLAGLFFKELYDRFVLTEKTGELLALTAVIIALLMFSTTQFQFHLARLSGIIGIILGAYFAKTDKSYFAFKGE